MRKFKRKNRFDAQSYVKGVLKGDRMLLSRAITVVESNLESDQALAREIIKSIMPYTGNSMRVGITGVPGVGKSTFIEAFGKHLISLGKRVAILSIDPSSQKTKGSILGDKTRMEELSTMEEAYIRPSASGESLGGVANKTGETLLLCEAAGYDVVLIETVGVGQSETAVHGMTDFFLLLMLAGAGDELQGIKKGIMEMADMVVINKADGANIPMSKIAKRQYENALHMFPSSESGWTPVVTLASAIEGEGVDTVWETIEAYKVQATKTGYFQKNRDHQQLNWMYTNINDGLKRMLYNSEEIQKTRAQLEKDIIASKISPIEAAEMILKQFKKEN